MPNPWSERVPVVAGDLRSATPEGTRRWGEVDPVVHLAALRRRPRVGLLVALEFSVLGASVAGRPAAGHAG